MAKVCDVGRNDFEETSKFDDYFLACYMILAYEMK